VIFFLFFISFSLSFMSMTREISGDDITGREWYTHYPDGTLGVAYWGFLGEFGGVFELLLRTRFGMPLLGVYLVLSNILLVNLLIAMMADTYSSIRDNSDKQWKFSRYILVNEYRGSTLCPPPLNLLLLCYRIYQFVQIQRQTEGLMRRDVLSKGLKFLLNPKTLRKKKKRVVDKTAANNPPVNISGGNIAALSSLGTSAASFVFSSSSILPIQKKSKSASSDSDEEDDGQGEFDSKLAESFEIHLQRMHENKESFIEKLEERGGELGSDVEKQYSIRLRLTEVQERVEQLASNAADDREFLETRLAVIEKLLHDFLSASAASASLPSSTRSTS